MSRRREKSESEWVVIRGTGAWGSGRVAPAKAKASERDDKARQLGGLGCWHWRSVVQWTQVPRDGSATWAAYIVREWAKRVGGGCGLLLISRREGRGPQKKKNLPIIVTAQQSVIPRGVVPRQQVTDN